MRVFRRNLWDERITLLSWAVVLAAFTVFAVSSYESFGLSQGFGNLVKSLPPYMQALFGGLDWGTPEGYLNTELFSWMPLLIAFYAGLSGASALSREVDSHTAESLLAQPIRRWSVVVQKFAAMLTGLLLLHLAFYAVTIASVLVFLKGLPQPSASGFFAATMGSFLTTVAVGSLALFISAFANEQRKATVYASGVVLLLYFVNVIGQISSKAKFLTKINPFGHYNSASLITTRALAWGDALFLVGFTIVFLGLAIAWFDKRDLA